MTKVFWVGLVAAILVAAQQVLTAATGGAINWLALGYAAFLAAGSYLAKDVTGQWNSVVGIIVSLGSGVFTQLTTGTFKWKDLGTAVLIAVVGFATQWAKSQAGDTTITPTPAPVATTTTSTAKK